MTILKYILDTGVCKSGEILTLKKENPDDYFTIVRWAREQAANEGIEIEEYKPAPAAS